MVLSSFVSRETGGLVFIDTESRKEGRIELPGGGGCMGPFSI